MDTTLLRNERKYRHLLKLVCLLWTITIALHGVSAEAQISVRLEIPTEEKYQVLAKNFVLKELLSLDDVVLVESNEQYRLDMLVKELISTENTVVGLSVAAYLMYKVRWDSVRTTLLEENNINSEESEVFNKLPSDLYFPILFVIDYCTVDGLRNTCASFIDLFNRAHFEKVRELQNNKKKSAP